MRTMELIRRAYRGDDDYWRMRNFLRENYSRLGSMQYGWHVAYLDHWRWHYIATCRECESVARATLLWETSEGKLAALLTAVCHDEVALHIDPDFRSVELEKEMMMAAEEAYSDAMPIGTGRILYVPVMNGDVLRQSILEARGYQKGTTWEHYWFRDISKMLPQRVSPDGYLIRSMGDIDEHPARSWCSWLTFHEGEAVENYDGDWAWFRNLQSAPLYRRDLDLVAVTEDGTMAAFCTISYDDTTRSAFCVLWGTAAGHRQQGLDEALLVEGMHRLQGLGCDQLITFAMTESENTDPQTRDAENEAFWDRLQETFDLTLEMACDWMDENDIEIDEADYEDYLALRKHVDRYTDDHPIMKTAETYRQQVHEWFKVNEVTFEHLKQDIRQTWPTDKPCTDSEAALWELSDIIDVILWYHTLMLAKLHRAVHQVIERDITGEDDMTGDHDGSAKVALIGMDRSLYAWNVLRKHLPDRESDIQGFCAQLEKLRRRTEHHFPNARAFIRLGLDD